MNKAKEVRINSLEREIAMDKTLLKTQEFEVEITKTMIEENKMLLKHYYKLADVAHTEKEIKFKEKDKELYIGGIDLAPTDSKCAADEMIKQINKTVREGRRANGVR